VIQNTLIKLGHAKIKEKEITKQIEENTHVGCAQCDEFSSQLDEYFSMTRMEEWERHSFSDYCDETGIEMCNKCSTVLDLIRQRKHIRRQIASLRGAITKYAISLVLEADK
jgi:hypothetical protein